MKLIDQAIDYITNRVLDRVEERKPPVVVHHAKPGWGPQITAGFAGATPSLLHRAQPGAAK